MLLKNIKKTINLTVDYNTITAYIFLQVYILKFITKYTNNTIIDIFLYFNFFVNKLNSIFIK